MKSLLTLSSIAALAVGASAADKPLLAIPGKVIYENTLSSGPDAKFKSPKGKWEAGEGALKGAEKPEDKHGAVTRVPIKLQDFVIDYEVKLEGAKTTSLSINDAKEHVARIIIAPTFVVIQKDDHDHDGPDKPVVFARVPVKFESNSWHKVHMELVGDTMLGKVDDIVAWGSNDLFKVEKANLGFTVSGQSAEFRNLSIHEATLNPDWESVKATLPKPGEKVAPAQVKPVAKAKSAAAQ